MPAFAACKVYQRANAFSSALSPHSSSLTEHTMHSKLRGVALAIAVWIGIGVAAGLWGAKLRYHVEARNRRVEIGVEWAEVALLAQMSQQPIQSVLRQFKEQNASTLIIAEDTLGTLEQAGAAHPVRVTAADGRFGTRITVDSDVTFRRIHAALRSHGIAVKTVATADPFPPQGASLFVLPANPATGQPQTQEYAAVGYTYLRPIGMGLPLDAVAAAREGQFRIAGRISNFPGVREISAESALRDLKNQGASMVIFNGDDALGYRGLENQTADLLRDPKLPRPLTATENPTGLIFGEVEFTKQKGDEKVAAALHGDYVRVHSIQNAEVGQLEEDDAIERYVKAARERNIRFCYVRLWTQAGSDPVGENVEFLKKISLGLEKGNEWTGGGMTFGPARQFEETAGQEQQKNLKFLFGMMGVGVAAGTVWLLRKLAPSSERASWVALHLMGLFCFALAWGGGETGRKLVALLAGIVFPTVACLLTFPRLPASPDPTERNGADDASLHAVSMQPTQRLNLAVALKPTQCLSLAVRSLLYASSITALGIALVIGLLATRPFMVRANQFLGIKAQHSIPLLIIAFVALAGESALRSGTWAAYGKRLQARAKILLSEPVRFGLLLGGVFALFAFLVIVERTGNDSSVGASGGEMKFRAILDTLLVARPRTKEFLVGHPAFILAIAWAWRGRRKLVLPAFVAGSIGQVSLLNTFCHIHTPLIISLWRDGLGLLIGTALGGAIFLVLEQVWATPDEAGIRH